MRKESVAILTIVLALVCIGTYCVYSALAVQNHSSKLFTMHCIYLSLGFIILCLATQVDYHILYNSFIYRFIVVVSLVLLILVLIPGIGQERNGAQRWLGFAGFSFQPSVLAKFAMILLLSVKLSVNQESIKSFSKGFMPAMLSFSLFAVLVLMENDLGTPVVMGVAAYILFFTAGIRWFYLLVSILPAGGLLALMIWIKPHRVERLVAFMDPWGNSDDSSWQLIQSITAFVKGGYWGVGAGGGEQKLDYLKEPDTDFIMAVWAEEMGLVGTLFLVMLFVALLFYGIRVATHAKDLFGTLLVSGIIGMVSFQAAFNMSVAIGLLPTKGLPLPFITRGGTSLMVLMGMMGIVINVGLQAEARKKKLLKPVVQQ